MSDKYNGPLIQAVDVKKNFGDQEVLKGIDLEALSLEEIIKQALKKMVK